MILASGSNPGFRAGNSLIKQKWHCPFRVYCRQLAASSIPSSKALPYPPLLLPLCHQLRNVLEPFLHLTLQELLECLLVPLKLEQKSLLWFRPARCYSLQHNHFLAKYIRSWKMFSSSYSKDASKSKRAVFFCWINLQEDSRIFVTIEFRHNYLKQSPKYVLWSISTQRFIIYFDLPCE